MKQFIVLMALVASAASASTVTVNRTDHGSGTPGQFGDEQAQVVLQNDIFHAPQYLPNYPTAATIWPRVVEVPCTKTAAGDLNCAGYKWTPNLGRGEYLFIAPRVVEEPVIVAPIHDTINVERSEPVKPKSKPKKKVKRKVKPLVCTK